MPPDRTRLSTSRPQLLTITLTKALKPKILYPYHYRGTEPQVLVDLLKSSPEVEVRVRSLA